MPLKEENNMEKHTLNNTFLNYILDYFLHQLEGESYLQKYRFLYLKLQINALFASACGGMLDYVEMYLVPNKEPTDSGIAERMCAHCVLPFHKDQDLYFFLTYI